jgi:Fe-S oxidoreductase
MRSILDSALGVHQDAKLPEYVRKTARQINAVHIFDPAAGQQNAKVPASKQNAKGGLNKVALFTTCYCNYNEPDIAASIIKILNHNDVTVGLPAKEHCCGMPKLELGDLSTVSKLKELNIPALYDMVQQGYVIMAAVPSCVLMFKQELPLMFPDDERVTAVAKAFHDPFEFLHKLHKAGKLKTDFKKALGNVSYHVACHQRVQNIGPKTRQILELIEDTSVKNIERCSGHDGTYGVKSETLLFANKIARPIVRQIQQQEPDYYGSDCPVAGKHIENNLETEQDTVHPIDLLRLAYGL